jgi:hypothetical protein
MGLLVFSQHLRRWSMLLNLGTHPLNLRLLLIQSCDQSFRCFLLLSDDCFEIVSLLRHCGFQFFNSAVFFEEFIE